MRRKLVAGLALAGASLLIWRRRAARHAEKVDLYYEDGSTVSLVDGSLEADRLLPLARRVLAAARG
jgi:hypothetical protein